MPPTPPPGPGQVTYSTASKDEAQFIAAAYRGETDGQLIMVQTGLWSLLLLIAAVRLAARHPAVPDTERAVLLAYADTWSQVYDGTPARDMAASGVMPYGVAVQVSDN